MSTIRAQQSRYPDFGALVISLDFELQWGVRDKTSITGLYRRNLLGARAAIPKLLDLFEGFGVTATWATVGFLFANSRDELARFAPPVKPRYHDARLYPYDEPVGAGEHEDPFHFAPSLIEAIRRRPGHEIGSHTFSHYYCLEPGQNREMFAADLNSAIRIARKAGIRLQSLVFPKNQYNPDYADLLVESGITSYRGNQQAWMYPAAAERQHSRLMRMARLADAYLNITGPHTTRWNAVRMANGLCNIPASFFLRPYAPAWRWLDPLRLQRITKSIRRAAIAREIVHLWWHPHNFGVFLDENIACLRAILEVFADY